jgi:predicted dehydrogenase
MEPTTIGVIGCGNIAEAYFKGAARSELIRVKSCADLLPEAAKARASEFSAAAVPVDALLADDEIEIVINLTVPVAHGPVSRQILTAGKHV